MGYQNGVYTRNHNFSADASAGIKILAARQDTEWDDVASALTNVVWTRDGNTTPTTDIPMGGFKFAGVGAPASALNMVRAKDVIENVPIYMVDLEASADRISVSAAFFTTASAATAPRDGTGILIKVGSDKSSAVAIRLNTGDGSPHSAAVVLTNGSAIYSGAMRSGGIYEFVWSSSDTAWQIMNPQVDYATSAFPGVVILATDAEVAAGTVIGHAVTPNQLASKFSASYATITSAGLIEIATTAEGLSGTNTSAAVTPAVMEARIAVFSVSASVGGPGYIQVATTAEGSAGTDTGRAITPAVLRAVRDPNIPYLMVLAVTSAGAPSIVSQNDHASSWTFTTGSVLGASWRVTHNLGLTSANGLNINIRIAKLGGGPQPLLDAALTSIGVSAFSFTALSASTSTFSANYFLQAFRMS